MKDLDYNPESGIFTWRVNKGRWGRIPKGSVAGHIKNNGYVVINLEGKLVYAHRLVFELEGGIPEGMEVDHINGDPSDNRRSNLRLCKSSENAHNTRKPRTNKTGVKNVHFDSGTGKFRVRIRCNGKHIHIGLYPSLEEATVAAATARSQLHGEYAKE
jgi:hypothetical protein